MCTKHIRNLSDGYGLKLWQMAEAICMNETKEEI